jgi:hypothetical protein
MMASMEPFWDLKTGEYVEYLMHVSGEYIYIIIIIIIITFIDDVGQEAH